MKKAYRRRYTSYFSSIKLPALISSDLIASKLEKLRTGDKSVRDDLIMHYLRLVFAITARIRARYPKRDANDLLGAGILALTECLDSIAEGTGMQDHDNLDAYVHKTVYHEIIEYIKTDWLIRPPLNSDWLKETYQSEGAEAFLKLFGTTEYFEASKEDTDICTSDGDTAVEDHTYGLCTPSPLGLIELEEILASFYFTTKEKKMIAMRIAGATYTEIGATLQLTQEAIIKRFKQNIIPRLKQLLGE
jgi:DNA-directed RNA polymerase specialized sigma subunit